LRIIYVGNFKPSHSTETHIARTLERLGHTVIRLQEDDRTPASLTRALDTIEAGLFMFTRTWGRTVTLDHLAALERRGIPTVSYHLDLYVPLARNGGIDTDPFWRTDYVFTPDGDPRSAVEFERRGINHRWMPPAVVSDECYLADRVPLTRDVVFVGSGRPNDPAHYHREWPYRGELLGWLKTAYGPRFQQHGGRGQAVRGYALNRLYASTRVSVGDSLVVGFTHQKYWSDRVYEAPGRGAFQILPWISGLDAHFTDGDTTVFYRFGDFAELQEKIDYYLTRDDERERIRRASHQHVKANHTYTHRLTAMLDTLRGEGAI
jgi:hypothetical protein